MILMNYLLIMEASFEEAACEQPGGCLREEVETHIIIITWSLFVTSGNPGLKKKKKKETPTCLLYFIL